MSIVYRYTKCINFIVYGYHNIYNEQLLLLEQCFVNSTHFIDNLDIIDVLLDADILINLIYSVMMSHFPGRNKRFIIRKRL